MEQKTGRSGAFWPAIILVIALIALIAFTVYVVTPKSSTSEGDVSGEVSKPEFSEPDERSEDISVDPVEIKTTFAEAEVGNLVHYGRMIREAGVNADGAATPIEWIVLDKDEDKLLLLSYKCLLVMPYNNTRDGGVTDFKQSSLCAYLNSGFPSEVFSEKELGWIVGEEGEKVFILSAAQASEYLTPDSHRTAKVTVTAGEHSGILETGKNVIWWLSDTAGEGTACYVYTDGSIRTKGFAMDYDKVCVRVALWVSADAEASAD